ncbi:hypothetical protein IAU59_006930 [Kwoniella sp. CBS 9459]
MTPPTVQELVSSQKRRTRACDVGRVILASIPYTTVLRRPLLPVTDGLCLFDLAVAWSSLQNCKSRRTKCESPSFSEGSSTNGVAARCQACIELGSACTFEAPVRKRGPQPGSRKRLHSSTSPGPSRHRVRSGTHPSPSVERSPSIPDAARPVPRSSSGAAAPPVPRGRLRFRQPFSGVPGILVDQLLPLYFTHVHNVWPLIYKPTFNAHTTSPPLLLSMLAIASCVTVSSVSPSGSEEDGYDFPSARLFRMAEQSVYECRNECRIDLIQSLVLLSLRQTGCGDKQSASTYAGRACCMALNMGLNLAPNPIGRNAGHNNHNHNHRQNDSVDKEVRSRVYWNVYVLDKGLSEETGRPFLLTYRRTTTPLPSVEELEEYETWPPPTLTASVPSHRAAHIVPRRGYVMSCFAWTCRLAMIVEDILDLDTLYPPPQNAWDRNFLGKPLGLDAGMVSAQLDRWHEALPSDLNVDPESTRSPLPHHAIGIAWYHTSRILLHSRYIKRVRRPQAQCPLDTSSSSTPTISSAVSRQICADAAQATIDILSCLDKYQLLIVASSDVLHILSLTALFEAIETTDADHSIAALAKTNFQQCCTWLRSVSASWPAASSHRLFFEGLIKAGLALSNTSSIGSPPNRNGPSRTQDRPRTAGDAQTGPQGEREGGDWSTPSTPGGLRQMRRHLSVSDDSAQIPISISASDSSTTTNAIPSTLTTSAFPPSVPNLSATTAIHAASSGAVGSEVRAVPPASPSALFQLPQIFWNSLHTANLSDPAITGTAIPVDDPVPAWEPWMDLSLDPAAVGAGGEYNDPFSTARTADWSSETASLPSNANLTMGIPNDQSLDTSPLTDNGGIATALVQSALMSLMMEAARGGRQ